MGPTPFRVCPAFLSGERRKRKSRRVAGSGDERERAWRSSPCLVLVLFLLFAVGLVLGEVHLAAELLALAEDLEATAREDRALALDRHHQLFVHAERLLVEHDVGHDRLLAAFIVERLVRREQLRGALAD